MSFTVWFTGLPGAGKASLAEAVAEGLAARGLVAEVVSSSAVRASSPELGFSREARSQLMRRHAARASELVAAGTVALVSAVSPFAETREEARAHLGRFVEVHVATEKAACVERDETGAWERALAGELRGFTGVDAPYEVPSSPELRLDLAVVDPALAAEQVLALLSDRSWLGHAAGVGNR